MLALALSGYAIVEIWLEHAATAGLLQSDWCRFGLCASDFVAERGYEKYLRGNTGETSDFAASFQQALTRDPASAYLWADEGEILLEAGKKDIARYCMHRSASLAPHSASILLRCVNFFFRVQEGNSALQYGARVLQETDQYDSILFSTYGRFGVPNLEILQNGIPFSKRPAQSYLRHLLNSSRVTEAKETWDWIGRHSFVNDELAASYLQFLVQKSHPDEAVKAWDNYLGARRGDYLHPNLVFNGEFETVPSPSPFDWQIVPIEGAATVRDSSTRHSGNWCLRIHFDGTHNVAFRQVSQLAVVSPGVYRLAAWMRAEGITTDQGVAVRVLDHAGSGHLDMATEQIHGSGEWRRFEKIVTVPPNIRVVQVEIVRPASPKFDNKIGGTVWIDSISLKPESGAVPPSAS